MFDFEDDPTGNPAAPNPMMNVCMVDIASDEELVDDHGFVDTHDFNILLRHVNEVTAPLHITESTLVVVDCVEGVCSQSEPVLFDTLWLRGLGFFLPSIKWTSVFLSCKWKVNPSLSGERYRCFFCGFVWMVFTLTNFAKIYATKFGVDESKIMERLWGENYFDPRTNKKWTTKNTRTPTCQRGFIQFVYNPIKQPINICMNDQKDKVR
ncbi:hypothetical protein L7F22_054895 [Adiantum nelumboides]|nr:hypothetical protein [Adiantum nelumboides]